MAAEQARELAQEVRRKSQEVRVLCQDLDEDTASRAPAGRWSPKQIISHLCGPEGVGYLPGIRAILEQDTPRLDIEGANPFFTENRSRRTLSQLIEELEGELGRIADFTEGLSEEQLNRNAHVPLFKETPIGEYPTLAMWVHALACYHVSFHIDHLREVLRALGAGPRDRT